MLPVLLVFFGEGCFGNNRWSEKEKKAFAVKCSQTDTTQGLVISFTGFQFSEIKNVLVLEVKNDKIVDSFYVHAISTRFDSLRNRYEADIDRKICIKDAYQFIISGQPLFVLSNMKMVMWPQFTMFSEDYGCVMGEYSINNVKHKHNGNPDLVKKGFR